MDFTPSTALDTASLNALVGTGGPLNGALVGLTKADVPPGKDVLLADVAPFEADYIGYARKLITWLAPSISDNGEAEIVGTVPEFRPTDAAVENTCWQAFVINGAGDTLEMIGTLDGAPIPMTNAQDSLIVTVRLRSSAAGIGVLVS